MVRPIPILRLLSVAMAAAMMSHQPFPSAAHSGDSRGDDHDRAEPQEAEAAGPHGAPGDPDEVSRTVEIVMRDIRFEPEALSVRPGATIRFEVRNEGDLVHEFNIGTQAMHDAHQGEMAAMMEEGHLEPDRLAFEGGDGNGHAGHDHANSVLLEPGETGELVWRFPEDRQTTLEFACNVPGHYEAGMVGPFEIETDGSGSGG